ncbi:MAG: hypothetical protein JWN48_5428 [Myxococcaceae bacterium]|nr:hypothetical protein [Myxococcaceae bacterium]
MSDHERELELWVLRLQGRFPDQTRELTKQELERRVGGLLSLCEPLHIEDERDVLRLIALLAVQLTPEQRNSKLIEGVVRRVLAAEDWDAEKRLDFLYEHVVGRPVSADEPDLGPTFVPATDLPLF